MQGVRAVRRWLRGRHRDEDGAVAAEFVVLFPLFMILVLGMFSLGTGWFHQQSMVSAAREGVRTGATFPNSQPDTTGVPNDAWFAEVWQATEGTALTSWDRMCIAYVGLAGKLQAEDDATKSRIYNDNSPTATSTGDEPCFDDGRLVGWAANRAHHAELGGSRPGSMPPRAATLAEEGVVIEPMLLVHDGIARLTINRPDRMNAFTARMCAELVDALAGAGAMDADLRGDLVASILRREEKGSTGFGKGVAVPHVKHKSVSQMAAAIGLSETGVDFNALDKQPVYSVFLLLSPEDKPEEHLQAMEVIFKSLSKDTFRRFLRQASSVEDVRTLLEEADSQQLAG